MSEAITKSKHENRGNSEPVKGSQKVGRRSLADDFDLDDATDPAGMSLNAIFSPNKDVASMQSIVRSSDSTAAPKNIEAMVDAVKNDLATKKEVASQGAVSTVEEKTVVQAEISWSERISKLKAGDTIDCPLQYIKESQNNARFYYSTAEVDNMGIELEAAQLVPAIGYVEKDMIVLVDGQKRLRSARHKDLEKLRIEICEKPEDEFSHYKQSRDINQKRSEQNCLDDSRQWSRLLQSKVVKSQSDLCEKLGLSEAMISSVISLNRIPESLRLFMLDRPHLLNFSIAKEFAKFFKSETSQQDQELINSVRDLMEKVARDEVPKRKLEENVNKMLSDQPKRNRDSVERVAIKYRDAVGEIKLVPNRGQLDLSIKGLDDSQLKEFKLALEKIIDLV